MIVQCTREEPRSEHQINRSLDLQNPQSTINYPPLFLNQTVIFQQPNSEIKYLFLLRCYDILIKYITSLSSTVLLIEEIYMQVSKRKYFFSQ